MATFNKFNDFVDQLGLGKHNLNTDTLKAVLTNSAPVATNTILANITQIASGNGYTTGGEDITNTYSETSGTGTMVSTDVTWTATGGAMATFRYVVIYNDTQTSPADPLVGWYDYGSAVTLATGESFTLDFGASTLTIV